MIPWLAGIDPESGSPRRRVSRLADIPAEAEPLIQLLVEQRLLATDRITLREGKKEKTEVTIEPAHEALLRQWSLLRDWLEEDLGTLTTLEGVKRAGRDWAANGRHADWLNHAGSRLEEAEKAAARQDLAADLTADARDYLHQCREQEEAAKRQRRERLEREREEQERRVRDAEALAAANRRTAKRTGIGLIVALALAGLVSWVWLQTQVERDRAAAVIALATHISGRLAKADPRQSEWQAEFDEKLAAYRSAPTGLALIRRWFRSGTVTIEGKPFMESSILVELMAIMIEQESSKGIQVERKHWGYPSTVFSKLMLGEIDVMPTYSATLLNHHLNVSYKEAKRHEDSGSDWSRDVLEQSARGRLLALLDNFGYKSNFALVMLRSRAKELGLLHTGARLEVAKLPSISDLEDVANGLQDVGKGLRIGTDEGFADPHREDGYWGLLEHYPGLRALDQVTVAHERSFDELDSKRIDVMVAYTTDPEVHLEDSPYVKLRDDRNFFLHYYAAPLARRTFIRDYPEVGRALLRLAGAITAEDMVRWIDAVKAAGIDGEKLGSNEDMRDELKKLCRLFLEEKGLLAPTEVTTRRLHSSQ